MVLTALTSLRSFHLPVEMDLASVTGPSTRSDPGSWGPLIASFWRSIRGSTRLRLATTPTWTKYHFSIKAGPSKGPAIFSALSELGSLPESLLESIGEIGGEGLRKTVSSLLGLLPCLRLGGPYRAVRADLGVPIRKIVGIEDKEGKTRVIAIGDY